MSADDTYAVRYEEGHEKPFVVLWRQNYSDWESPTRETDSRFNSFADAVAFAVKSNADFPAEYGVVFEEEVTDLFRDEADDFFRNTNLFEYEDSQEENNGF